MDQPALALANPGGGQHGLLSLDDILPPKLDADWVVLSACNTAAGDVRGGEAISGLGRGFFYSGSRSLLVTHWPVETVSAQKLVVGVFNELGKAPQLIRAEALRRSMLKAMTEDGGEGKMRFSYAHPIFLALYLGWRRRQIKDWHGSSLVCKILLRHILQLRSVVKLLPCQTHQSVKVSHKVTIPVLDLQIGMFVSDIDRPWIETPFLMQELLIENETEIATLRQYCHQVTVDRSRSLGDAFAPRVSGRDAPRTPSKPTPRIDSATGDDGFADVCRRLRSGPLTRSTQTPELDPASQRSRLEPELLYSAPIIDDVKNTLKSIREALISNQTVSLTEVGQQIGEMARAVERNPDAMIWLARLRSTDQYSYDHALDVSVHLMVFARFLGLPTEAIENIGIAGLMQDIGKVFIPAAILAKPDQLSEEEYAQVQAHVASSLELLVGHEGFPTSVLEIIASHHERFDGSGYPRRLKGERICFHGELAGLVDSYCAMTRERPYGAAISSQKAQETLIRMRGRQFRESVVDQFIQCIGLYPTGSLVELNTGEVGVVIQQNQVRRLKPRLLIVLAPDKSVERHPITLDLMMDPLTPTGASYRITQALPTTAYGIDPSEFYLD